jgi:hypothetical protein
MSKVKHASARNQNDRAFACRKVSDSIVPVFAAEHG